MWAWLRPHRCPRQGLVALLRIFPARVLSGPCERPRQEACWGLAGALGERLAGALRPSSARGLVGASWASSARSLVVVLSSGSQAWLLLFALYLSSLAGHDAPCREGGLSLARRCSSCRRRWILFSVIAYSRGPCPAVSVALVFTTPTRKSSFFYFFVPMHSVIPVTMD